MKDLFLRQPYVHKDFRVMARERNAQQISPYKQHRNPPRTYPSQPPPLHKLPNKPSENDVAKCIDPERTDEYQDELYVK